MYLVHARMAAPGGGATALPSRARVRALVLGRARPEERVEHVAVHPHALPHPVLGFYVLADRLAEAEATARAVCRRVLRDCPEFDGWSLLEAEVPLMAPLLERELSLSGPGPRVLDGKVQGPFGPPGTPSGGSDQRRK
ncbi:hypothetical protein HHL19_11060 [Streptomyces sp. R302]|uniref:hypothetical protein n=1 Tax=unclassified Streptomyces TaxID=2593676 RepID=UPI00145F70F3|nr:MULTISPECIES: hypothetical protein [unclassified Streptomyces]NML50201.1 hypothetical protein [Streptomyces sp. R301]NML79192.1 hypothetical protein [Streptomyces sp. R302]